MKNGARALQKWLWPVLVLVFCGLIAAGQAAPANAREAEIYPGIWEFEFTSITLKAPRKFCVVVPDAISRTASDWPVLFWLHGRGRTHRSLVDVEAMRGVFREASFCTVFPQGDDGWYVDSPVRSADCYEADLEEILAAAARARPLSRKRERRAITGWSMGGYGAVRFATRRPGEFSVVVGIIGLLDFPRMSDLPEGQNYKVPVARFGEDPTVWARFNPLAAAEALRDHAILIVTASDAFDRTMNEHFHERLRQLKIPHEYLVLPGAHTFPVVQAAVPRVIDFVGCAFADPLPPPRRP